MWPWKPGLFDYERRQKVMAMEDVLDVGARGPMSSGLEDELTKRTADGGIETQKYDSERGWPDICEKANNSVTGTYFPDHQLGQAVGSTVTGSAGLPICHNYQTEAETGDRRTWSLPAAFNSAWPGPVQVATHDAGAQNSVAGTIRMAS
ncbi:unnamed protein product [Protopolystoma xenopodis]|uniref:Uncharacterized protein n=1 Tax=Protopolystoma xenopodis TaxID=117903 RepID=A0A3S5B2V7_9PLAT|nr:unnamed protein product [Protopolystoma xenopodis]